MNDTGLTNEYTIQQVSEMVRQWETDGCVISHKHPSFVAKQLLATMQREAKLREALEWYLGGDDEGYVKWTHRISQDLGEVAGKALKWCE